MAAHDLMHAATQPFHTAKETIEKIIPVIKRVTKKVMSIVRELQEIAMAVCK